MLWFYNLSFRWKFVSPILLVVLIFSLLFSVVFVVSSDQAKVNSVLNEQVKPTLEQMDEGYRDLYQVITAGQGILLANDDQNLIRQYQDIYADDSEKALSRLLSAQLLVDSGFIDDSHRRTLSTIEVVFTRWLAHYKVIMDNPSEAADYYFDTRRNIDSDFNELVVLYKSLRTEIELAESELTYALEKEVKTATVVIEAGMVLALIFSLFIAWFTSGIIITPLRRLSETMHDISKGEGDLTQRIHVESTDEIGQLGNAFNAFISTVHQTISEVSSTLATVQSATQHIQAETQGVRKNASSQQEESAQVATAVHEMSATSDNVSDHANEAAQASQHASDESNAARTVLGEAVNSIHQLADDIDASSQVITELEQDVGSIASILDVIRGIADQTNLLALNAAIEAARAGEQGRGFAVVADEVRSLASKTQASTGEIQAMIERLQLGAKEAVVAMESSRSSGVNTVGQANTANESLDAISHSIEVINEMNLQIATAAAQQSQVSEDINKNVQHIADMSHEVVNQVHSTEHAFDNLAAQCQQLSSLVGRFKI
ncbi:methyl-accepting chemotaxis protein [Photobacterium minamisatsumaniensis]|uniref:methyl-accepting chemotaxis protein n=1 Tax=Photobacterium minamisatsumaniensis TaxID=2910233 RepID=UPI003D0B7A8A